MCEVTRDYIHDYLSMSQVLYNINNIITLFSLFLLLLTLPRTNSQFYLAQKILLAQSQFKVIIFFPEWKNLIEI